MSYNVVVPATLANLGPGFDVLGMAIELVNEFTFERRPAGIFESEGERVAPQEHLCFATALAACERFGGDVPGLALRQKEAIPRGQGLGSSATARVAGLMAWCWLNDRYPSEKEALGFVSEQEGHPDNAVAAMIGGLTISAQGPKGLTVVRTQLPSRLRVALCCPDRQVLTDEARAILPDQIPRQDAVYTGSRLGLLLAGLFTDDADAISVGLSDRLHEPYRAPLIGPVAEALAAARLAGAVGGFISGSGSTLAAFVMDSSVDLEQVARAMCVPFEAIGITCVPRVARPRDGGAWDDVRAQAG